MKTVLHIISEMAVKVGIRKEKNQFGKMKLPAIGSNRTSHCAEGAFTIRRVRVLEKKKTRSSMKRGFGTEQSSLGSLSESGG